VEDGADGQAVLVGPAGRVQLNGSAVAILRLCDGSRSRAEVVAEMVRRSRSHLLVSDIGEFLDAARARKWIVEEAAMRDK
jgi:pyrroloquinoline quinone biosynthesis protein D